MKSSLITCIILASLASPLPLSAEVTNDITDDRLIELRAKAKAGDVESQLKLANEYYALKQDHTVAALWYRKAAKGGSAEAAYRLAQCYDQGDGIDKSEFYAFKFYQQAADQKHLKAKYELALKHSSGIAADITEHTPKLPRSPEAAMKLLNELAVDSYAPAMREIAQLYLKQNTRTTADTKTAYKYLLKAVKTHDAPAMRILADCLYKGIGCKKDLEKMIYYLKQAAKRNDIQAQARLAFCYENGIGITPDFNASFMLHQSAADQGFAMSQVKMGDYHVTGEFLEQSLPQALQWYKKAATQNQPLALYKLGTFALQGIGMKTDAKSAFEYLLRSSILGYAKAQLNIAFLFKEGRGTQADDAKAFFWFQKSALQGEHASQLELAFCYMNGKGVKKDQKTGLNWLKKSAAAGNREARQILKNMID